MAVKKYGRWKVREVKKVGEMSVGGKVGTHSLIPHLIAFLSYCLKIGLWQSLEKQHQKSSGGRMIKFHPKETHFEDLYWVRSDSDLALWDFFFQIETYSQKTHFWIMTKSIGLQQGLSSKTYFFTALGGCFQKWNQYGRKVDINKNQN